MWADVGRINIPVMIERGDILRVAYYPNNTLTYRTPGTVCCASDELIATLTGDNMRSMRRDDLEALDREGLLSIIKHD